MGLKISSVDNAGIMTWKVHEKVELCDVSL